MFASAEEKTSDNRGGGVALWTGISDDPLGQVKGRVWFTCYSLLWTLWVSNGFLSCCLRSHKCHHKCYYYSFISLFKSFHVYCLKSLHTESRSLSDSPIIQRDGTLLRRSGSWRALEVKTIPRPEPSLPEHRPDGLNSRIKLSGMLRTKANWWHCLYVRSVEM